MMRGRRAGFRQDRSGASAIEFALLVGPLLLIFLGAVEFGRLYWSQHVLHEVASSSARCMALLETACTKNDAYDAGATKSFVKARAATMGVTLTDADIVLNRNATCSGMTGFSSVVLANRFSTAAPQLLEALTAGIDLSATACFPNAGA